MRSTIHVVSARDYWLFADGIGPSREAWWRRVARQEGRRRRRRRRPRAAPRRARRSRLAAQGARRAPSAPTPRPSGKAPGSSSCACRRSGRGSGAAPISSSLPRNGWGRSTAGEEAGLVHLLRRYLGGFGPGTVNEAANWAGVPVTRDEGSGRAPEAPALSQTRRARCCSTSRGRRCPMAATRRTGPLPPDLGRDAARPRAPDADPRRSVPRPHLQHQEPAVVRHVPRRRQRLPATWRWERAGAKATLVVEPFERLPRGAAREVRDEAARLVRFVEPDATSYAVRL